MKMNLFGLSGGKDSCALVLWAIFESGYPKDSIFTTFCDTGNEHEYTYNQVRLVSDLLVKNECTPVETVKPEMDFWQLAFHKGRFPSQGTRFCTEQLKIWPMQDWVSAKHKEGYEILSHSGVRADESKDRNKLLERDLNGFLFTEEYRPLLRWTVKDVIAIHERYNLPLNPLYAYGAKRVGCFPCVMSVKQELRSITLNFKERIEKIAEEEQRHLKAFGKPSTFFHRKVAAQRFRHIPITKNDGTVVNAAGIRDIAEWSLTGKMAKGSYLDNSEAAAHTCESGFCE
jgi:3'-phosphoadenosine 5'-phosphosulfate sulfotransferase (PAPS reductase)/FAD synthetase